jgi:hypothetical protein
MPKLQAQFEITQRHDIVEKPLQIYSRVQAGPGAKQQEMSILLRQTDGWVDASDLYMALDALAHLLKREVNA